MFLKQTFQRTITNVILSHHQSSAIIACAAPFQQRSTSSRCCYQPVPRTSTTTTFLLRRSFFSTLGNQSSSSSSRVERPRRSLFSVPGADERKIFKAQTLGADYAGEEVCLEALTDVPVYGNVANMQLYKSTNSKKVN